MSDKNISTVTTSASDGYVIGTVSGLLKRFDTLRWSRGRQAEITAITGTAHTLVAANEGALLNHSNASASTISIPNDTAMPLWPVCGRCRILRAGAGQITVQIVSGSGVTLLHGGWAKFRTTGSVAELIKTGANSWVLTGDTSAT